MALSKLPKSLSAALLFVWMSGGGYREMTRETLIRLEGVVYEPYRDIGGVLTVCVGHTGADIRPRRYNHAECMALLDQDLKPVYAAIDQRVTVPLTPYQRTALATFIFNVGPDAFARSTLLQRLNAGDFAGARAEMARWVYARGRKWRGLMNRREAEMAIWDLNGPQALQSRAEPHPPRPEARSGGS